MGIEIERKYLVHNREWEILAQKSFELRQGYLSSSPDKTIRIRCSGDEAWITLKNKAHNGLRKEFEYAIPLHDAIEMLHEWAADSLVHKTRYHVPFGGYLWEVDVFHGANEGLILAEIELPSVDTAFEKPSWLGEDVTEDHRYSNSNLSQHPFQSWS